MINGGMKTVYHSTNSLEFAEYNPRQLTESQYKDLKESMEKFGFVDPIIINVNTDRKNVIIGGHQRVRVANELGINKIPCVEIDLEYEQERELNVRLNKNTGKWDWDVLANEFEPEDLISWGFTENELQLSKEYDPAFSSHLVDYAEMEKRDQALRDRWKNEAGKLEVCCPECGHEFQINEVA